MKGILASIGAKISLAVLLLIGTLISGYTAIVTAKTKDINTLPNDCTSIHSGWNLCMVIVVNSLLCLALFIGFVLVTFYVKKKSNS